LRRCVVGAGAVALATVGGLRATNLGVNKWRKMNIYKNINFIL